MRTCDLSGAALDWAVAKCELPDLTVLDFKKGWERYEYAASIDWEQGGPIIEREKLTVIYNEREEDAEGWRTIAYHTGDMLYGPTPLVAAMRCFVASKLGDEVEIPEELSAHATPPEG